MKTKKAKNRCEGWRRFGGAFTLGPVRWEQCKETGTVMLKTNQGGAVTTLPACPKCWAEAVENKIVIEATPITSKKAKR